MSTDPATPLDLAAIMAEHQSPPKGTHCSSCGTGYPGDTEWPCETYRLAADLVRLNNDLADAVSWRAEAERLAADLAAAREREQRLRALIAEADGRHGDYSVRTYELRTALAGEDVAELERGGELPTGSGSNLEGEGAAGQPQGENTTEGSYFPFTPGTPDAL